MIESLEEIYKGAATVIKNKQYYSAKEYISPFIDRISKYTDKTICLVRPADQLAGKGTDVDIIYNKVLVTGVFPEDYDIVVNDKLVYHRVICMAYALDTKIPVCKFYTGVVDTEANFYAFGKDCIQIQKLEPDTPIDYSGIETVINNGLKDNCEIILKQNVTRCISKEFMFKTLGEWIDFTLTHEYINDAGKVKLSNTLPVTAYKSLILDKDSDYYSDEEVLKFPDIMAAFLFQITDDDKDIINRYEKTQLVNNLLKL